MHLSITSVGQMKNLTTKISSKMKTTTMEMIMQKRATGGIVAKTMEDTKEVLSS